MIHLRTARMLAVALLGIMLGSYVYQDDVRRVERGRDAFLAFETQRFSRTIVHTHHLLGVMITGILAASFFIGFYKLLSAGLGKVIPVHGVSENQE